MRFTINPPLLLVTDRYQATRPLPEIIADYWEAGGHYIWLREKDLPKNDMIPLLETLLSYSGHRPEDPNPAWIPDLWSRMTKAPIILSQHADLVARYNLAGVHLPQSQNMMAATQTARAQLKPGQWLGISIHNEQELEIAQAAGPDYVIVAPIFATASKPGYGPTLGTAGLKQLAEKSRIAIIALGGITPETTPACLKSGAQAIAVMGEFMRESETQTLTKSYMRRTTI